MDRESLRDHIQKARLQSGEKVAFNGGGNSVDDSVAEDEPASYSKYAYLGNEEEEDDEEDQRQETKRSVAGWSAPRDILEAERPRGFGDEDGADLLQSAKNRSISSREGSYQQQRLLRILSPDRSDAFASRNSRGEEEVRSYAEVMRETQLEKDRQEAIKKIRENEKEQSQFDQHSSFQHQDTTSASLGRDDGGVSRARRKRRWDVEETGKKSEWDDDSSSSVSVSSDSNQGRKSRWDDSSDDSVNKQQQQRKKNRWDETPLVDSSNISSGSETPALDGNDEKYGMSWAPTPKVMSGAEGSETPRMTTRSRWDETPVMSGGETPSMKSDSDVSSLDFSIGIPVFSDPRWAKEYEFRNRPLSDEELDSLLPSEGFKILPPPPNYKPLITASRKAISTPSSIASGGSESGFFMHESSGMIHSEIPADIAAAENLPLFKPEDVQFFGKLLDKKSEDDMTLEEAKERKIMRLLLRIKNGTPQLRKQSLKEIAERARYFGAGALFNQILPLMMSPSLEDQERHLLVKVIDRILFKLDELVRPYVHKILVVMQPLLIDEDYYARVEGREIISNLSKAAGLATMIATMRPDIDHVDEYVRNTTSRAFAVVASALGIPALLPFLKAVCKSKKSWQARHTGIKIVQQIAILMGCGILPHLKHLVEAIAHGLGDQEQKVRTITALAIASLGEASAPYGIESFDIVLRPLWDGIQKHRGKSLAAFIKAIGFIIPLMDAEYAAWYTTRIMTVLVREFSSPDEEMKKIVLKVVRQCAATEGITGDYIKQEILPEFFRNFWIRRMALDKRNYKQVVETTYALAQKAGGAYIIEHIQKGLKDEAEQYRKMVLQAIHVIVVGLGCADVSERQLELLVDGMLTAFQEQSIDDQQLLDGIGAILNAFGMRCKPFLPNICSTVLWRLNNKSASIRQQSAELIARIASVMHECGEDKLLSHLGVVLYEYLGEEYPEVLGSILAGLKGIVSVIGMAEMNPPIKDLLPRLTPILKNRHERVQEHSIDLVGRIADRGAEFVSAREWMRICFELVETLKAHRKDIRRAAINTFGYIAKAIGPQDVLATLLNNLKVQERQNRVCTTVAIAIVAETCAPFTVLPALMNEYRVPELNVQNGVLKSMAFMFEYIGEMAKDYVYAVTPLLEDALMDRDVVHRQTACTAVKHLAVDCFGMDREDALLHLLNFVWPNVFEVAPHMANAFTEAVEGLRLALGPGVLLYYILPGLFHPARKVREAYWKVYNSMYIASQDALVPFYPRIEDDENHSYVRQELNYFL